MLRQMTVVSVEINRVSILVVEIVCLTYGSLAAAELERRNCRNCSVRGNLLLSGTDSLLRRFSG
jgi:hypothetical protein